MKIHLGVKPTNVPLVFVILLFVADVKTIYKNGHNKEPSILLLGYRIEDTFNFIPAESGFNHNNVYNNDYVFKDGSDYVITDGTNSVDFTCEADYPITWTLPEQAKDLGHFINSEEHRTSQFVSEKPNNLEFRINIRFHITYVDFLNMNLTCNSVKPDMSALLQSSVHLYLKGKSGIEHEGKTLQIFVEPKPVLPFAQSFSNWKTPILSNLPPVLIPCRPSSPDLKIFLYKEEFYKSAISPTSPFAPRKTWSVWEQVMIGNIITFDPKIGFIVNRNLYDRNIFGSYKCSMMMLNDDFGESNSEYLETDQFVYVNITKQQNTTVSSVKEIFEHRSIIHGKASVLLTEYPYTMFTCCSGIPDKPPILYAEVCTDSLQCDLLKGTILEEITNENATERNVKGHEMDLYGGLQRLNVSSDCTQANLYGGNFILACRGDNVDYMDHLISVIHPLAGGSVTNRSQSILEGQKIDNHTSHFSASLLQHISSAVIENVNVSQKMVVIIGYEMPRKKLLKRRRSMNGHMVYVFNLDIQSSYKSSIDNNFINKSKWQYFVEYDRDVYYENEPMTFACFGIKYVYATNPHLRLTWENGTRTLLEEISPESGGLEVRRFVHFSGEVNSFSGSIAREISIFSKNVLAKREMSFVECFMPKKQSVEWEVFSKEIKVLSSVAPTFVEKLEETIYLYLGDVGNAVTCTIKRGLPLAKIGAKKDGKWLQLHVNKNGSKKASKLRDRRRRRRKLLISPTEDFYQNKKEVHLTIGMSPVRHDHQGVYECIAKNVNSTVIRTVKIFVLERSSVALPLTISCVVGILILVLVGLGIKHWYDRKTVQSCRQTNNNLVTI